MTLPKTPRYDVVVIGGGIVGLATAYAAARSGRSVAVVEREPRLATHQTGRNSNVIHSGLYYAPGGLKARLAVAGCAETVAFCREHDLPHQVCGKLVVATEPDELPRMTELARRGDANGVENHELDQAGHAGARAARARDRRAVGALHRDLRLPGGRREAGRARRQGGRGDPPRPVGHQPGRAAAPTWWSAATVRSCSAPRSWRARACTATSWPVPRGPTPACGSCRSAVSTRASPSGPRPLVRGLIYPVPDPAFPFLGVHATRGIDGHVHAGPNAVLALAREGYGWGTVNPRELLSTLAYPGMLRVAKQHWRYGFGEMHRSLSKAAMARQIQRMLPDVQASDLSPAGAGVRAQAVKPDGTLVDDFLFVEQGRGPGAVLHVLNAPSPAATAALPIGREILARAGIDALPIRRASPASSDGPTRASPRSPTR